MPERGGGTGTVLEKSRMALLRNFSVNEVPWSVRCEDCGHSVTNELFKVSKTKIITLKTLTSWFIGKDTCLHKNIIFSTSMTS